MLYKNLQTGKVEKFDTDKIPYTDTISYEIDTTKWQFIDQEQTIIDEGEQPAIHDFSISNVEGSEYTTDILEYDGYYFFIINYDLDKSKTKNQSKINDFAALSQQNKVPVYGLTSSSVKRVDQFRHDNQILYDYYITDATQLKTFIRSNPGLVLMKGDLVVAMWHYNSWPVFSDVKSKFGL
jgi:triosephosphate isomerase